MLEAAEYSLPPKKHDNKENIEDPFTNVYYALYVGGWKSEKNSKNCSLNPQVAQEPQGHLFPQWPVQPEALDIIECQTLSIRCILYPANMFFNV